MNDKCGLEENMTEFEWISDGEKDNGVMAQLMKQEEFLLIKQI